MKIMEGKVFWWFADEIIRIDAGGSGKLGT